MPKSKFVTKLAKRVVRVRTNIIRHKLLNKNPDLKINLEYRSYQTLLRPLFTITGLLIKVGLISKFKIKIFFFFFENLKLCFI